MKERTFGSRYRMHQALPVFSLALALGIALPAFAQQNQGNLPGYPSGNEPQTSAQADTDHNVPQGPTDNSAPATRPEENTAPNPAPRQNPTPSTQAVPATIVVPEGTVIQVRTNEWLSTDRNLPGDGFNATLAQPIVVDGWVVARRGQSILGRVTMSQKANSSNHNTSQLGMQLSELTFADGQLLPIQTHNCHSRQRDPIGDSRWALSEPPQERAPSESEQLQV